MSPGARKGLGMLLLLGWMIVWIVLAASAWGLFAGAHWTLQALYFLVAGIVWVLPLKPLLRWMETGRWRR
jgi:hypothetical protein